MRPLTELRWESRLVDRLPGDPIGQNYVRQVPGAAYSLVTPTPVAEPRLIGWSDRLGEELGIARPGPNDRDAVAALTGNLVLPGMKPYAARYAGHQFGQWAGQLGDGRAITLGEADTKAGRRELQLKGAGRTPYSRRGDGRAVLRSSLREFLCSEAMYFLGVPTTRALSLTLTGEDVIRDMLYDGNPAPEPGAVVCRVAPSFLRFGNFEMPASLGETELLRRLADLLVQDHYPELAGQGLETYARLLDEIARRTARLMVEWQRVGFVHGVMNTDNLSVLGLTIDYGPYGWLEPYDPDWTPNTTDAATRRYRFGNQPAIALWNLARLAEALSPLGLTEERLRASLELYREEFRREHPRMQLAKIGVAGAAEAEDEALLGELHARLAAVETDYTLFFRHLADWHEPGAAAPAGESPLAAAVARTEPSKLVERLLRVIAPALYDPAAVTAAEREAWAAWLERYEARLARDPRPGPERAAAMRRVNPKYVPRNWLAQQAIDAAERGDLAPLERLMRVLERPYDEQPAEADLAARRPDWARSRPGCSALSCSS